LQTTSSEASPPATSSNAADIASSTTLEATSPANDTSNTAVTDHIASENLGAAANNSIHSSSTSLSDEEDQNNSNNHEHETRKQLINKDIVLLMDSNRKYIQPDSLHGRGKIIRCAEAKDIISVSDEYNFQRAKHIFISTGTNDVGANDSNEDDINRGVDDIVHDIINGAENLHSQYPSEMK
jgi:hypothetical protein